MLHFDFIQLTIMVILPTLYSLITFDERVTFWLKRAQSLPCACVFAAAYACVIA